MSTMSSHRGGRSTSTYSTPATSQGTDGSPVLCNHKEPAVRLQCKNGPNRNRYFYKCNGAESAKCRFFQWEDGKGNIKAEQPDSAQRAKTPGGFPSNSGGNVLGGNPPQASSSSTEYSSYDVPSPSKRKRMDGDSSSTQQDSFDQESSSLHMPPAGQAAPRWTPASRPATTPTSKSRYYSTHDQNSYVPASPAPPLTQSVEDALLDDWDEDIEDFDDFEAGGSASGQGKAVPESPLGNKKPSKLVSFGTTGSPLPPKTPPRLAPGLPLTPTSNTSKDKWREIREDPSSPFFDRSNKLLGKSQVDPDTSVSSSVMHPLLTPPRTSQDHDKHGDEPVTPAKQVKSLSEQLDQFNRSITEQLASAAKSLEKNDRLLLASNMKAKHHQENERKLKDEIDQLKDKIRLLEAENTQLKAGKFI